MVRIVDRPDESMELGLKFSSATYAISEAKRAATGTEGKSKAIQVMKKSLADLKVFSEKQENIFDRFIRRLLNLFGIVTNYQRIINQIEHLEAEAQKLTKEESLHLEELHKQKDKAQKRIGKEVSILSRQFTEIEAAIEELNRRAKQLTRVGDSYHEVQKILAVYQKHLREMKSPLSELSKVYQGDIGQFQEIPQLWERHAVAEKALQAIAEVLANLIQPRRPNPPVIAQSTDNLTDGAISTGSTAVPGGIHNGGNTCYLASAMQAINSVSLFRDLFNPQKTPLVKRKEESEPSYQERLLIQSRGFEILEKIRRGVSVSTKEINSFRVACYNHEVSRGKRVVNNTYGPMDAVETMDRLLTVLDYKGPQMIFKYQDVIVNPDVYEDAGLYEPSGALRKADDYRTIEEAKSYRKAGTLTLSAYPYLNGSVAMNALLKDFWKAETLDEYFVKHIDKENGTVSYRKYKNVERKITLDLEKSEMPKVLLITIQQLDGNRATITRPDEIYPSGIEGIGPRYKLASGIEHLPGHYVAHVATANGIVQANDGWVHPDRNSSFPGYGYVYVLDNS